MRTKFNVLSWAFLGLLLVFAAPNIVSMIRGAAPTPEVFAQGLSLDEALDLSEEGGKPVLVLVTADWCPPCQALKRGALTDDRVAAWIGQNTIPVYVDHDRDPDVVASLGVRSLPTTYMIRGGEVRSAAYGNASAEKYLRKLKAALDAS